MSEKLQVVYSKLKEKETQLIIYNTLSSQVDKIDSSDKEKVLTFLKTQARKRIDGNVSFNEMSPSHKTQMLDLGFDVIRTELEVLKLNLKTSIKVKRSHESQEVFLNVFNQKLSEFKTRVMNNKSDFEEVERLECDNSIQALSSVSRIINDTKLSYNETDIDNDVESFLNGREFEL